MQDRIRASQLHLFSADPPVKTNTEIHHHFKHTADVTHIRSSQGNTQVWKALQHSNKDRFSQNLEKLFHLE